MSMKYYILALILFLTRLAGFAQQVMLADSITKNPICYATVYDANGTVIGRSDMGGYINLQKGFEYHISHISYYWCPLKMNNCQNTCPQCR